MKQGNEKKKHNFEKVCWGERERDRMRKRTTEREKEKMRTKENARKWEGESDNATRKNRQMSIKVA